MNNLFISGKESAKKFREELVTTKFFCRINITKHNYTIYTNKKFKSRGKHVV